MANKQLINGKVYDWSSVTITASGMENITWFFGQVLFVGGSGGLLVQSTLAGLGIEVELAQLAAIEIPVCIIATVVAIVFYVIKDRKMIQKYYK